MMDRWVEIWKTYDGWIDENFGQFRMDGYFGQFRMDG